MVFKKLLMLVGMWDCCQLGIARLGVLFTLLNICLFFPVFSQILRRLFIVFDPVVISILLALEDTQVDLTGVCYLLFSLFQY